MLKLLIILDEWIIEDNIASGGIGAAGVFNSNHHGEAAYYILHALKHDMIGIVATNGSPNMPAWGGTTKMTGPLPFTAGG